jgi:hypothetical protein
MSVPLVDCILGHRQKNINYSNLVYQFTNICSDVINIIDLYIYGHAFTTCPVCDLRYLFQKDEKCNIGITNGQKMESLLKTLISTNYIEWFPNTKSVYFPKYRETIIYRDLDHLLQLLMYIGIINITKLNKKKINMSHYTFKVDTLGRIYNVSSSEITKSNKINSDFDGDEKHVSSYDHYFLSDDF